MRHPFVLTVVTLLLTAPAFSAGAGTLQIWEDTLGAQGTTAEFGFGSGLIADLDFDASSAEGGGLPAGGPTDILIKPLGDLVLTAFSCQFAGCTGGGVDFTFTPGGEGTGQLFVSDPDSFSPKTGPFDIGLLEFEITSGLGSIELLTCNYFADGAERTCDPFQLVIAPEPGTGALLALGIAGLAIARRRRA